MSVTRTKIKIVIVLIIVAAVMPTPAVATHVFDDVADDRFYSEPVQWAATTAITTGKSTTEFDPAGAVTRGESVTFLRRYDEFVVQPLFKSVVRPEDGCAAIQIAINALPAGGGEVLVGAGTYVCFQPIVIDRDNVKLRGEGQSTMLTLADGANTPLLIIGNDASIPGVTRGGIVVTDLYLDGNRDAQPDECWGGPCEGPNFRPIRNNTLTVRRADGVVIERVVAKNARSGGLVVEQDSRDVTVRDFESYGHTFDGLAAYLTTESRFTGLYLHDNDAAGLSFDDEFDSNIVSDAIISDNATVGVFMRFSRNNQFSDLQILRSGEHGVFIAHIDDATTAATGNSFSGLMVGDSVEWGVFVANDTNNNTLISGAQFFGNGSGCVSFPDDEVVEDGTICR